MNIIGIGAAGCKIASCFKIYSQYNVFCIDSEEAHSDASLLVKEQNSHEEYEKNYKRLNGLSNCKGLTTIIVCGSGKISGISLRVIEQLKKNKINIIYVKPDVSQLANKPLMRHRTTFGILQEYARSGLLNKLYVVSNSNVELILENISLGNYWQDINNLICSAYHMLNVFENTEPLLTTLVAETDTARIGTFGVANFDTGNEKLFYDLQRPRSKKYFYGISENSMSNNRQILHLIRERMRTRSNENTHASFSIYSTDYDQNYVYSKHYASLIQEQILE